MNWSGVITACRVPARAQNQVSSTNRGSCVQHAAAATKQVKSQRSNGRELKRIQSWWMRNWSCQLAFGATAFDAVVPWLEAHRDGLDVFVHGQTGDAYADHTAHAMWLGNESVLDFGAFRPRAG